MCSTCVPRYAYIFKQIHIPKDQLPVQIIIKIASTPCSTIFCKNSYVYDYIIVPQLGYIVREPRDELAHRVLGTH